MQTGPCIAAISIASNAMRLEKRIASLQFNDNANTGMSKLHNSVRINATTQQQLFSQHVYCNWLHLKMVSTFVEVIFNLLIQISI